MGIIYAITCSNGKKYIGQHNTNDAEIRMKTHIFGFNAYINKLELLKNIDNADPNKQKYENETKKGCISLYRAFAKYGIDNFTYEILHTDIQPEKLNALEDSCIIEYNTLAPNGYNLRLNHANGEIRTLSEESKNRFSAAAIMKNRKYMEKYRKYNEELKDMPQYINYYQDKDGYRGYKINKHPKCYSKSFTSKTIPLEILKQNCMEFITSLDVLYVKKTRIIPIGICKPKKRNGYMAYFKINKKRYSNYFNSSDIDNENLQSAIDWLHIKKQELGIMPND